jgi:dephospho-CoA kinase
MKMEQSIPLKKTFVIGLVGGIAAGKSTVAESFKRLGIPVIDADELAHEVLAQPPIALRLGQVFGDEILTGSTVNRSKLAAIVFGESPNAVQSRQKLEAIVHPLIHASAVNRLLSLRESAHPPQAVVLDAPLLLEAGWAPMCDAILFIDTPYDERLNRCRMRGWTETQFANREQAQMQLNEKRANATHILSGLATAEEMSRSITRLLDEIKNLP